MTGELLTDRSLERRLAESRVLIHATPIGMHPREGESLVPPELMHADLAIMDIVYNPIETKLLTMAKTRGCVTINGLGMFIHQGVEQFRLWTGLDAPVKAMAGTVEEALRKAR